MAGAIGRPAATPGLTDELGVWLTKTEFIVRDAPSDNRTAGVRGAAPDRAAGRAGWCPIVALPRPRQDDAVELLRLYASIEAAIAGRAHPVVQIAHVDAGGGNIELAYDLAWTAASLLGKRILFVDAGGNTAGSRALPARMVMPKTLLADVVLGLATEEHAVVAGASCALFAATLHSEQAPGGGVPAAGQMRILFDGLRPSFDMIVVAPTAVLARPLATILTTVVDGSVMVLDAGTSRARQVAQCASLLAGGAGPLIGAVMRRRRNFVPAWLRRWV